jgi:inorganic pyrophosphatase
MDFKAFIEIPALGAVKYEIDEETGELTVDRFLHTAFVYPFNYGFIKHTKGADGDPLDVVVLSTYRVHPGAVMKCHAVGLLEMEDEAGEDTKILAVPDKKIDPEYGTMADIDDVSAATKAKIKHFFENYKTIEPGKWVRVKDFKGAKVAEKLIESSFTSEK